MLRITGQKNLIPSTSLQGKRLPPHIKNELDDNAYGEVLGWCQGSQRQINSKQFKTKSLSPNVRNEKDGINIDLQITKRLVTISEQLDTQAA